MRDAVRQRCPFLAVIVVSVGLYWPRRVSGEVPRTESGEVELRAVLEYEGERGGRAQEEAREFALPLREGDRVTARLHLRVPLVAAPFSTATLTAEVLQGRTRIAKRSGPGGSWQDGRE